MMRWARVFDGKVVEITDLDPDGRFHPDFMWVTAAAGVNENDSYDEVMGFYSKTPETNHGDIKTNKINLVQIHLDIAARDLNYENISNAITYADEPSVPKFQKEGLALRAWRSLVWEKFYQILNDVDEGNRIMPTDDELISELPELVL